MCLLHMPILLHVDKETTFSFITQTHFLYEMVYYKDFYLPVVQDSLSSRFIQLLYNKAMDFS